MAAAQPAQKPKSSDLDIAVKLQNSGKLDEAEAIYNRLVTDDPRNADAQHNIGLIKLTRGEPAVALPYLYYSLHLKPNSTHAHNTLGNALLRLGRKTDAETAYRKSVEINASNGQAWFNLGALLQNDGRNAEAETCYKKTIALNPNRSVAYLNLANIIRSGRRFDEALAFLLNAVKALPNYEPIHNNLGNAYRDLDRLDEAVAAYRKATSINPNYALAWLNLGSALNHMGRREESIAALRHAINAAPRLGEAHMHLAAMTKPDLDAAAVTDMKHYFDDPATSKPDRMYLGFALGQVHNDTGSYDKAFSYWREGNKLKRASVNYDVAGERLFIDALKEVFTKEYFASAPQSSVTDKTPIFIVGMMRSGTTLMEQIFASHPDVVGADELTWIPDMTARGRAHDGTHYPHWMRTQTAANLTRLGESYVAKLRQRFGDTAKRITDKLPGNFLAIGFINRILPQAKIIHMRRNPYDTCLSIYSTLFAELHHYAYDLAELSEFYTLYHGLMRHWEDVLPGTVLHQDYERLTADPETEIRKVLDFCGLPFDARCLAFHETERRVRTASSNQVREKLHNRSVERWRNYERHLGEWKTRFAGLSAD